VRVWWDGLGEGGGGCSRGRGGLSCVVTEGHGNVEVVVSLGGVFIWRVVWRAQMFFHEIV